MATAGYKEGLRSERNRYVYFRTANTIEELDYNENKDDQADYSSEGLDGVTQVILDVYGADGQTVRTVGVAKSVMNYNPIIDRWEQVPGEYIL